MNLVDAATATIFSNFLNQKLYVCELNIIRKWLT